MGDRRTRLPRESRRRSSHGSPLRTPTCRLPPHHYPSPTRCSHPRERSSFRILARRTTDDPSLPALTRWIDHHRRDWRNRSPRPNSSRSTGQVASFDGLPLNGHRYSRPHLPRRVSVRRSRSCSTRERRVRDRRCGGVDEGFDAEGEGEGEVVAAQERVEEDGESDDLFVRCELLDGLVEGRDEKVGLSDLGGSERTRCLPRVSLPSVLDVRLCQTGETRVHPRRARYRRSVLDWTVHGDRQPHASQDIVRLPHLPLDLLRPNLPTPHPSPHLPTRSSPRILPHRHPSLPSSRPLSIHLPETRPSPSFSRGEDPPPSLPRRWILLRNDRHRRWRSWDVDEVAAGMERPVGLGDLVDDGRSTMVESTDVARVLGGVGGDQRGRVGNAAGQVEEEQKQTLGDRRRTEPKRHGCTVVGRRRRKQSNGTRRRGEGIVVELERVERRWRRSCWTRPFSHLLDLPSGSWTILPLLGHQHDGTRPGPQSQRSKEVLPRSGCSHVCSRDLRRSRLLARRVLGRVRLLRLRRIRSLLRSLPLRSRRPSLPQRVPRPQGFRNRHPQSFLPPHRVCDGTLVGEPFPDTLLHWSIIPGNRRRHRFHRRPSLRQDPLVSVLRQDRRGKHSLLRWGLLPSSRAAALRNHRPSRSRQVRFDRRPLLSPGSLVMPER